MGPSAVLAVIFTSLILFVTILYFGTGVLMHAGCLSYRMYRRQAKVTASEPYQRELKKKPFNYEGEAWFRSMDPAETVILSGKNERLHGYTIPAAEPSDRWVICIHGYAGSPEAMGPFGRKFHNAGFHTLYPALRGHESSGHRNVSMGWHDRLDIIDWCRFVADENPGAQIVLFGVSMGASAAMMASGETLPSAVRCVVADCGFSSVWDIFSVQIRRFARLPASPFLYPLYTAAILNDRLNLKEASCVRQVTKSKTPTLFIHGGADKLIPPSMMEELFDAAGCEKEKLLIANAGHIESANTDPELYWSTVRSFVNRKLTAAEPVRS